MATRNAGSLDPEGRERVTLEATYQLTPNPPAPAEPPERVPNPGPVYIIPSATGRIPPLNAYPMPDPPKNLVPNPLATRIMSSAPPLPELPPSLNIEIPFRVDEASSNQDVGLSEAKAIRDLAMEAITYNVQQLLAARSIVDRIEAVNEREHNEITFRIIMDHFNPDLTSLASILFKDEEKKLVRVSLWRSGPPTQNRLDHYGEYVHDGELLAQRLGRLDPDTLLHVHMYLDRVMDVCNKLLHFMEAPHAGWILNHPIMKGYEYTPRGGWIEKNRMVESTLDYALEEKQVKQLEEMAAKTDDEENDRHEGLYMKQYKRETKL